MVSPRDKSRPRGRRQFKSRSSTGLIIVVAGCLVFLGIIGGIAWIVTRIYLLDDAGVAEQYVSRASRAFRLDASEDSENGRIGGCADRQKASYVRDDMMRHAWGGYETYAWGQDELNPLAKKGKLGVMGGLGGFSGMGASLVDAMSTLYLMGLHDEFGRAREWVVENMDFGAQGEQSISFFETTIRLLGGLLSAHDLSGDKALLELAEDLGDRLIAVFDGERTGIATNRAELPMTRVGKEATEDVLIAEGFSNLIEFGALGIRTGREEFQLKAEAGARFLHAKNANTFLLGKAVSRRTGQTSGGKTIGAPSDSYYEYLLKYWILTGKKDDHWRDRWVNAVDEALDQLLETTQTGDNLDNVSFIGELFGFEHDKDLIHPSVTHLGCFFPGNIALGVMSGAVVREKARRYLDFARDQMSACMLLYSTKTGLGADDGIMDLKKGELHLISKKYFQRPEVVESLFYLWRATHEPVWREHGWNIVEAIEEYCRVDGGYVGISDVDSDTITYIDVQQSWFLAETLKYLYLLFEDDAKLDVAGNTPGQTWVFNTEAHPVKAESKYDNYNFWVDWKYLERTCVWPLCDVLLRVLVSAAGPR